jgi:hypothetical protein
MPLLAMHMSLCYVISLFLILPGEKWLRHEVNHSSPTSTGVTNEWSYTSAHPACHQGKERENFNITFLLKNFKITEYNCLGV